MNIAAIDYSIGTKSLDIYVAGCNPPHCKGCHNPELWDFNAGIKYASEVDEIILNKPRLFGNMIDKIIIMGGEPLHQDLDELILLLETCQETGKDIVLFTRKDFEEIPVRVLAKCDFVKCGRYDESFKGEYLQHGIVLGSFNQKIFKKGEDW